MHQQLVEEFDQWAAAGRVATFWWRDDDAVQPTPYLHLLLGIAGSHPISLAVIPGKIELGPLADRLAGLDHVAVLQHGWQHIDHSHRDNPTKSEYPDHRSLDEVSQEILQGRSMLVGAFGACALPVFAPPFGALSDCFLPILATHGIPWISCTGPRRLWELEFGVLDVNVHVGVIDWKLRRFGDPVIRLCTILDHLRARRTGQIDYREPTGILTHHLQQDKESYLFITMLLKITDSHKSARWLHGREVFSNMASVALF